MIAALRARAARRRWVAETLIAAALAEQPDQASWPLMSRTGLTGPRPYGALGRMQADGRVVARWQDGIEPRHRLYRLAD